LIVRNYKDFVNNPYFGTRRIKKNRRDVDGGEVSSRDVEKNLSCKSSKSSPIFIKFSKLICGASQKSDATSCAFARRHLFCRLSCRWLAVVRKAAGFYAMPEEALAGMKEMIRMGWRCSEQPKLLPGQILWLCGLIKNSVRTAIFL
jgi:hypothetical protein